MTKRWLPIGFVAAALVLTASALAQNRAPSQVKSSSPRMVQCVYTVADLIVPLQSSAASEKLLPASAVTAAKAAPLPKTIEDRLIRLIASSIAPMTWNANGGAASIDYYPLGMSLVVTQTPDIQEQVSELLSALRKQLDVQVAVEVRFVSLTDEFFERIGIDFEKSVQEDKGCCAVRCNESNYSIVEKIPGLKDVAGGKGVAFLDDKQVKTLIEVAQGDRRATIMQAPKLTTFNGQRSSIQICDQQFFVTDVEMTRVGDQVILKPKNEAFTTGLKLSIQPLVSADHRYVKLSIAASETTRDSAPVPLYPVQTTTKGAKEKDGNTNDAAVTQFVQQPRFSTMAFERAICIPSGGTAMLGAWKKQREVRNEYGPPVLSKVPYINRLVRTVGVGRESETVLVLVTPRIILNKEQVAQPSAERLSPPRVEDVAIPRAFSATSAEVLPTPIVESPPVVDDAKPSKVGQLLEKYHEACRAGKMNKARKLAERALAIDPACFSVMK